MTPEEEEKLVAFASKVALQQCMPGFRFTPPSLWRLTLPWWALRGFLISRLDNVKEDPYPQLWAQEFIKTGEMTRLAVWSFLILLGMCTAIEAMITISEITAGLESSFAENLQGWTYSLIWLGCNILGMVICAAYLRRDWLRR
jgi:hypothetical protein